MIEFWAFAPFHVLAVRVDIILDYKDSIDCIHRGCPLFVTVLVTELIPYSRCHVDSHI